MVRIAVADGMGHDYEKSRRAPTDRVRGHHQDALPGRRQAHRRTTYRAAEKMTDRFGKCLRIREKQVFGVPKDNET
jgi:hypothetical protein